VFLYHAGLLWVLVRDARTLPAAGDFTASRQLPEPLSLGAEQEVLLGVSCARAAGLRAAIADHAPLALRPSPAPVGGVFAVLAFAYWYVQIARGDVPDDERSAAELLPRGAEASR